MMARRIEKLETLHRYAAQAADNLESVGDAVVRGAEWLAPMATGEAPHAPIADLRRRVLLRDLERAHTAIIHILTAMEFEIDAEQEIAQLTRYGV